jgi:hypothetical protein
MALLETGKDQYVFISGFHYLFCRCSNVILNPFALAVAKNND